MADVEEVEVVVAAEDGEEEEEDDERDDEEEEEEDDDQAAAPANAELQPPAEEKPLCSPSSMYRICLKAFFRDRNNPELHLIRFLPSSVIIDMLHTVSNCWVAAPLTFVYLGVAVVE